jgi:hypothetical protein
VQGLRSTRGAAQEDAGLRVHQANMRELERKKFKCRKCGGSEVRAYLPNSQKQVEMFLAGDPAGTMRRAI